MKRRFIAAHNFDTSATWSVSVILTLSWRWSNVSRSEILKPYIYIAILLQASDGLKVLRQKTACNRVVIQEQTVHQFYKHHRPLTELQCLLPYSQPVCYISKYPANKAKLVQDFFYYDSVEITKKTQPCNRIYYSTVHWRLNKFRAAYRSSSGALTVFAASGLHTHVVTGRSQVWVPTQIWLRPVTPYVCKPEAANTVRAPDDERYAARNMFSL